MVLSCANGLATTFSHEARPKRGSCQELPASGPVAMCAQARDSVENSSPFMKIFCCEPLPVAALKNALGAGRSAEQKRPIRTFVPRANEVVFVLNTYTLVMRSLTLSTVRLLLAMIARVTNAPLAPWRRTMPLVSLISWFTSTVKVPSPLSNAPRPSMTPASRCGVPSALLLTVSPTDMSAMSA